MNTKVPKTYKTLLTFPIYRIGWEMDNVGKIIEDSSGKKHILLTSHGCPYLARPKEIETHIKEYEDATACMKKALTLLKQ